MIRKYENEEQKIRAINDQNWARRHFNQWELYVAAKTKRSEFEAEVRVRQLVSLIKMLKK